MTEESVQIQGEQDSSVTVERSKTLSLYGMCTTCFAPDGVLFVGDGFPTHLCPGCAQQRALWEAGYQQLLSQVREVAIGWLKVWGNVPGINNLEAALEQVGQDLYEELQPELANHYREGGRLKAPRS